MNLKKHRVLLVRLTIQGVFGSRLEVWILACSSRSSRRPWRMSSPLWLTSAWSVSIEIKDRSRRPNSPWCRERSPASSVDSSFSESRFSGPGCLARRAATPGSIDSSNIETCQRVRSNFFAFSIVRMLCVAVVNFSFSSVAVPSG